LGYSGILVLRRYDMKIKEKIKDAIFRFYGNHVPIEVDLFLNDVWLRIKWKWQDFWMERMKNNGDII
jgi:hypothetical protein